MDSIVAQALVGLARQEQAAATTATPVDTLIAALPEGEAERIFLLGAGAWTIYRQAGKQAQEGVVAPEAAGNEDLPECSPEAALLLSRLLHDDPHKLLSRALARMGQRELRLPYALLPAALTKTDKEIRATIAPVLGVRGRWLSSFNSSWSRVQDFLPADENVLPADAETIWQEGSQAQRVELLRRLRSLDAEKARTWLEAAWKREKAEARNELLTTFVINLSLADEPFLEKALDDRATDVRARAATLLSRLPDSALSTRWRERGGELLKRVDGKLFIEPPTTLEKSWQRDGIVEQARRSFSQRGWWLLKTLSSIPPSFWETHLGASPAELLAELAGDMWETHVIEGWSRAAIEYEARDWMPPLWSWWHEHYQQAVSKQEVFDLTLSERLLQYMPGSLAEQTFLHLLLEQKDNASAVGWRLLAHLPRPWSAEFAQTYLRLFREEFSAERLASDELDPNISPWFTSLRLVALALPADCFAQALQPWELPESTNWQTQYIRQRLQEFTEILDLRQKIDEEIV